MLTDEQKRLNREQRAKDRAGREAVKLEHERAVAAQRERWNSLTEQEREAKRVQRAVEEIKRDAARALADDMKARKAFADAVVSDDVFELLRWNSEKLCKAQAERVILGQVGLLIDRAAEAAVLTVAVIEQIVADAEAELVSQTSRLDGIGSTCAVTRAEAVWRFEAQQSALTRIRQWWKSVLAAVKSREFIGD